MKVVINKSHGEFDLSDAALKRYNELNGYEWVAEVHRTWS